MSSRVLYGQRSRRLIIEMPRVAQSATYQRLADKETSERLLQSRLKEYVVVRLIEVLALPGSRRKQTALNPSHKP